MKNDDVLIVLLGLLVLVLMYFVSVAIAWLVVEVHGAWGVWVAGGILLAIDIIATALKKK
jgi:hypothetical protein